MNTLMKSPQLNERAIKAALIDWLLRRRILDNAVLVPEMPLANFSGRADVAVANGHLLAYEIKGENDSLRRLRAQVSLYRARFDKVTVVTVGKFLESVADIVPPEVEILEARTDGQRVNLRVVRRGRCNEISNKTSLLSFLRKEDVTSLLNEAGFSGLGSASKSALLRKARSLSVARIREFVLRNLKARYCKSFREFLRSRGHETTADDISRLVRYPKRNPDLSIFQHQLTEKGVGARSIDIGSIEGKWGSLPVGTPRFVRVREKSHSSEKPSSPSSPRSASSSENSN